MVSMQQLKIILLLPTTFFANILFIPNNFDKYSATRLHRKENSKQKTIY